MTGAGKTFTMMGDIEGGTVRGLYTLTIEDIFTRITVSVFLLIVVFFELPC